MINGRSVLALIPARGGSKGLPGKNIAPVLGRPLLAWTVEAARASVYVDRVVLSSDDDAIIAAAIECGCEAPFRRPAELATDAASSIDVVLHALDQLPHHDLVVLLQPTSPLRTVADIDAALACCVAGSRPSCVSVTAVEQSPYWMYLLDDNNQMKPVIDVPPTITRRQDLPAVYALNGAIYVAESTWLRKTRNFIDPATVAYVMPSERSLDIDTPQDLETFKSMLEARSTTTATPLQRRV